MLRARRQFLNEGHYSDLADLVCNQVVGHVGNIMERQRRQDKQNILLKSTHGSDANDGGTDDNSKQKSSIDLSPRQRKLHAKHKKRESDKALKRERGQRAAAQHKDYQENISRIPLIVDLGCGEGWYTSRVASALANDCDLRGEENNGDNNGSNNIVARIAALDASKDATHMAARDLLLKKDSYNQVQVHVAVADAKSTLPFADNSVAVVMSIFAPRLTSELHRILKRNGMVVIAQPTLRHLQELGQIERNGVGLNCVSVENKKEERVTDGMTAAGFKLTKRQIIQGTMQLSAADVANLVNMGPSGFHQNESSEKVLHALMAENVVTDTTKSFVVLVFES